MALIPDPNGGDLTFEGPKWMHTNIGGLHFAFVIDDRGVIVEGDEATQSFVGLDINSTVMHLHNLHQATKRPVVWDAPLLN